MKRSGSSLFSKSITAKVNLVVILVFLTTFIAFVLITNQQDRERAVHISDLLAHTTADAFFDGLNTLMLTGAMAEREILVKKTMNQDHIRNIRVIRSEAVSQQFGEGEASEKVQDEMDRRALKGEELEMVEDTSEGRVFTKLFPIVGTEDTRGVNCMGCHQVASGTVLGVIRVSYSMAALDAEMQHDLLIKAAINLVLYSLGVLLLAYLLRRWVINRIQHLYQVIKESEVNADLGKRVSVTCCDELGELGSAFNAMQDRFKTTLQKVVESTDQLINTSEQLSGLTTHTKDGVAHQQTETKQVATAISQMAQAANDVAHNAAMAAEATDRADHETQDGKQVAERAVASIETLARDVEKSAEVIRKLETDSASISTVVETIRGIAEQTNLLALNAAIEAARAGESGRGFAVVADEVRTLASRTQASTEEIDSMISGFQDEIRDAVSVMGSVCKEAEVGVEHVEKAGSSLCSIAEVISAVRDMNTQIATAVEQQSAISQENSGSITRISTIAEETSEDAHQASDVGEQLAQLATTLRSLVKEFRI